MTANINDEFVTVDLVASSDAATSGVDAFALSVIKAERQIRRLFTHTVFQCPEFTDRDVPALRQALAANKGIYLDGFIVGIDHLWPSSLSEVVGHRFAVLLVCVYDAIAVRNKIFHGQLTDRNLSRADLLELVAQLRAWCQAVADAGEQTVGYDGFKRNSFRKGRPGVAAKYRRLLGGVEDYADFLRHTVQRRR